MKVEDHGIDGFDPLAHTPMEFTVQSAIDNLKSIRNKKVDLPIAVLESLHASLVRKEDTHDIPKPTERYDIDVAIRGKSDLPNPHTVNSSGQYVDSTNTRRESCGCSEANVLDNNHNVCTVKHYHVSIPYFYDFYVDATSEKGAIEIAHEDGNGKMGECDDDNVYVEEISSKETN